MKQKIATISIIILCLAGLFSVFLFRQKKISSSKVQSESQANPIEQAKEEITEKLEAVKDSIAGEQNENNSENNGAEMSASNKYYLHKNITSTIFWVGEKASDANNDISNSPSAWDENWKKHFGGTDTSQKRNGFYPSAFVPKENPFYIALPFNDFDKNGNRRANLQNLIPWANEKKYSDNESVCKNRWVKITKGSKTVYAQWEDVGPFKENDAQYVFGTGTPASHTNNYSGIDASPAVRDYLGLKGIDKVDWQFVDASDVPAGPWKNIITTSQINWN
jgi:hypothetical protein